MPGLITPDPNKSLQEFHLARTLASGEFRLAVQRYWRDPRYEETLGLLLSLLAAQGRTGEIADGLGWRSTGGRRPIGPIPPSWGGCGAVRCGSACI